MLFYHLAILMVFIVKTIAVPTALAMATFMNGPKPVDPKMTCDQLPENSCLYSFYSFYTDLNSATTTMTDQKCNDYGQDHFVFNRSKAWMLDFGPVPVKNHVWVISNFTRLNTPMATVSFMGRYNNPQLQWLDKSFTVLKLLDLSLEKTLSDTLGFGQKSIDIYRAEIPC
ncbi:hypothetical protein SBOR_6302 [Sclerotinia borealis F-4128]|uniref:Uncharacterized protein n=1 Tax=Sclerotinia borealis (strain F-4128) TaxID=1432307 RepID=W9CBV1_SCLBF|nr:hypothetical protein SBOR_6302 [Sclerotinia borealis F-4128]